MPINNLHNDFRSIFPEIVRLVDAEHVREWGSVGSEMAFSWFESLAKAINKEMAKGVPVDKYLPVFEFLRRRFMLGNEEEKKCIDVSFVENLFWGVSKDRARSYWLEFPDVFRRLYVAFHGRAPV